MIEWQKKLFTHKDNNYYQNLTDAEILEIWVISFAFTPEFTDFLLVCMNEYANNINYPAVR
jgi:hypothetical protein